MEQKVKICFFFREENRDDMLQKVERKITPTTTLKTKN